MDLHDCYLEEDLFPMVFTESEERDYGILFYNTENKDSFDSNHAVIYKDRIDDLHYVLADIVEFYATKGIRPMVYQSMLDDDWFDGVKVVFTDAGFKSWTEDQEYMLQTGRNTIVPDPETDVRMVCEWNDGITAVFMEAAEPWEIKVAEKTLDNPNGWMFAAHLKGKPVGVLYGHVSERICRVDYLLVSPKFRRKGVGRALFNGFVEWCKHNDIERAYTWPAGATPKRIYEEGGYSVAEVRKAGRAVFET